jgi:hypothetical protein
VRGERARHRVDRTGELRQHAARDGLGAGPDRAVDPPLVRGPIALEQPRDQAPGAAHEVVREGERELDRGVVRQERLAARQGPEARHLLGDRAGDERVREPGDGHELERGVGALLRVRVEGLAAVPEEERERRTNTGEDADADVSGVDRVREGQRVKGGRRVRESLRALHPRVVQVGEDQHPRLVEGAVERDRRRARDRREERPEHPDGCVVLGEG